MTAKAARKFITSVRENIPVIPLSIALMAFVTFAGTLANDLVWDDHALVSYTRSVVEKKEPVALFTIPFTENRGYGDRNDRYYRPVSLLAMWLNDPLGQPSPILYHLFNVLLHVVNSVLVYVLFLAVLREKNGAFLGGLIFAVHPVHAESVAWVSGRTDMLAAFFTLVALILWRRTRERKEARRAVFYALGLGTFMLACLAKETAFLLPVLAVPWMLTDWFLSSRKTVSDAYPDLVWVAGWGAVLCLVIRLRAVFLGAAVQSAFSPSAIHPEAVIPAMIGEVLKNLTVYLRFLSFPVPLRVYYPPGQPGLTLLTLAVSAGVLVLCLVFNGRRHRFIGVVALAWILVYLGPVTGVLGLGLSVVAERFCYLPSAGFALLAGYVLSLGFNRIAGKRLYSGIITMLIVLLAAGGAMHASGWKDDVTFFEKAINDNPVTIANMYYNLGNAYVEAGAVRRGIETLEEALRRYPDYGEALVNLAAAHIRLGEHLQALELLERAEGVIPDDVSLWSNKAVVLELLGRNQEALEAYEKAARLDPANTVAVFQKANLLFKLGKYNESLAAYKEVRTIDPDHYGALLGTGRSLEALERPDASVEAYLKAVEQRPKESAGYLDLGRVLLGQGKPREAALVYRTALDLGIKGAALHRGLVISYFQSGKVAEARRHIDILSRNDPSLGRELSSMIDEMEKRTVGE